MSRIGRAPITIPQGVDVKVAEDNTVTVKGAKGTLSWKIVPDMKVEVDNGTVSVKRPTDSPEHRSLHGLSRTLISNMVTGVSEGYTKELLINGVGYRAAIEGKKLVMNIGFSHQVVVDIIDGITIECPAPNRIIVSGIDKQAVGQIAADIRMKRPPEPYMGKGIRYKDEVVRRKEGKTGIK